MNGMGTDVLALACILGGAAVGGGVTMAALNRGDVYGCTSEAISVRTVVVGTGRNDHVITVTPTVRAHADHGCAAVVLDTRDVQARMDEARARMQEALSGADEARARADEIRQQVDEARQRVEEARDRGEAARSDEVEARIRKEMANLEKELSRLDAGKGR